MSQRHLIDIAAYLDGIQHNPCFIWELISGNPDYQRHATYEDEIAIAFLNKYAMLFGYTLIAPHDHRKQITGDFTLNEYLALQRLIHSVTESLRQELYRVNLQLALNFLQFIHAGLPLLNL